MSVRSLAITHSFNQVRRHATVYPCLDLRSTCGIHVFLSAVRGRFHYISCLTRTFSMMQAAYSIASTTLVLNLRAELHNDHSEGGQLAADIPLDSASCIDFAPRTSYDAATQHHAILPPTYDNPWIDGSELYTEDVTDAHSCDPYTTLFHEDTEVTQRGSARHPTDFAGAEGLEDVEIGTQRNIGSNLR